MTAPAESAVAVPVEVLAQATGGAVSREVVKVQALATEARDLAQTQRDVERAGRSVLHVFEPPQLARRLQNAKRSLGASSSSDARIQKAAEWFLDNYYLIRRVARQVAEELPKGFVRRLPLLTSGSEKGRPRVDALAHTLVAKCSLSFDLAALRRFVDAYQEESALTIAELWALPTMLRATVLLHLLQFIQELHVPAQAADRRAAQLRFWVSEDEAVVPISLEAGAGVERAIRALRVLDVIDWKAFFEHASRVEAILRTDPSQVYARMDFETCDSYRKVVEELAWTTGQDEADVASLAIRLTRDDASDERRSLVGYYLVAEGRAILEKRLGYRPVGRERVRRLVTRWPVLSYLLPLALLTLLPVFALASTIGRYDSQGLLAVAVLVLLSAIPASAVAVTLLHVAFARLLPPRTLPKLDLSKGLPREARTLVVIPTLLGRTAEVNAMVRQIERHYLSNPDPQLQFALLTDDLDAKARLDPSLERPLLESASRAIAALNAKHGRDGEGPFHLLHRDPIWNPAEERFMGWERKRGKLEELNRLLRGDESTSYSCHVGNPEGLRGIRFVITLDSDSELPMGSAHRLIGLLAHPLNRAVFDPKTGRVVAGYTVIQPRIETSPSSSRRTLFSRIFAGDIGLDIYTHACSELYQDLFGAGIYVGKGIYDVDAFMRSVEGRAPENALVSHDLFEGIHGRTALASDIVLFESYPESYATYAMRMHRWVRGDWQLLPWLLPSVPTADGRRAANRLTAIDRWKIADNLRRSLMGPLVLVLLCIGWLWLPAKPELWTLATLGVLLAPLAPGLASGRRMRMETTGRGLLAIVFLAYEAVVVLDAMLRVLVRKVITRKHLLQWTSAAHAAHGVAARSPRAMFWQTMAASPALALSMALLVAWLRPSAWGVATPFILAWFVAPEVARWLSQPAHPRGSQITEHERRKLRLLARRTWRFFDVFVGPNDQWLPIDNYQEDPSEQTAHRTSPTNIGLSLLATLTAYDFGYVGPSELSLRLRRAFDSIMRLPHYQGHLYNWYDTKNLQALLPRYVSTVDSGNFAGCLLALKQGCREIVRAPVIRAESWAGLRDSIDLLEEVVESADTAGVDSLRSVIARMQRACREGSEHLHDTYLTLQTLCDETSAELDRELLVFLDTGAHRHEADLLHALRTSIDSLHRQLRQMRQELDGLLPWLKLQSDAAALGLVLPTELRLDEIATVAAEHRAKLEQEQGERLQRGERSSELDAAAQRLLEAFRNAETNVTALVTELETLATCADQEAHGMDFKLLYDTERKLFHIGYNATSDQIDAHYYDLLASEARLASYLAIVKRDVAESHWYALGRPMTQLDGAPALLSWGGTMFEYLMPSLLMRSQPGTLLARTNEAVVDAQIAYGKQHQEPWGISESAYARVDADQTYQYRSFGVPGLGFKRGLEEDRVVTPYASMLAVSIRPRAVIDNLVALESVGMLGTYGLFEALDFTPERALHQGSERKPYAVVRSYMAHHQGMLLVALGNELNARNMVERFHADPMIETGEALLNERAPDATPAEWPLAEASKVVSEIETAKAPGGPAPWLVDQEAGPQAFVLSNGRLTSLLTASGGGGLRWQGLSLTRYQPDPTCDEEGVWLYLRDEDTRQVWLATAATGRTTYSAHRAELHLRREGISVHVDVAVAAADDVEVRQVTLHNETSLPRRISVTTAGRPVLLAVRQAPVHPAFSSMFVESERLADLDALLFARRPQTPEEPPAVLVHRLVHEGTAVTLAAFESDRRQFFGRTGSTQAPQALAGDGLQGGSVGAVLDPIISLTALVTLAPKGSVTLAFVTTVGRARSAAVELARKYGSMHAVRWTFHDAEQESARRLQRAKLEPALLPTLQRLFSALLYGDPSFRATPGVRAATPPSQRRLWAHGISGDDPIVLVRVANPDAPILAEMLAVQRYLRSCRVRLDLVLVDEQASGYVMEGLGTLRSVLTLNDADEWLNRHGGVFVVAADQLVKSEVQHLEACARVILDTRDGSLAARVNRPVDRPPRLPQFESALIDDAIDHAPQRRALLFDNGSGGFSRDGHEYVIDVVPGSSTPAPWCNVLANPQFGCLVSESSLGTSWSLNSGENRLTPWSNDAVFDPPSEALYLRDEETAEVWSPTPLPAGQRAPTRVRHGAGYTTYERESQGLEQELTLFVPPDAGLKVIRLRVKNTLGRHRRLTATYYAEWVLGSRRGDQRPYIVSEFDHKHACLLASCGWNEEFGGRVAFLASKNPAHGFTADRTEFLGRRGDYAHPDALGRWGLSGRTDLGADPCAALQVHLELAPGEELETHFILGQAAGRDEALQLISRFREPSVVEAAWKAVHAFWDGILGCVRVKTPELSMDLMLNRWLLYQTLSCRIFGRTGFYQSSGAFGYRDQLQDVLALLHAAPSLARDHILEAAAHQFEAGDVLHWWHPPSGRGVRTRCSDDLAWLPFVTAEYIAATGDTAILDEPVTFLAGEALKPDEHDRYAEYQASGSSASLFEHCRRALERAITEGAHGLPLMGDGDWNDGMSRIGAKGRGESVWLGWFLCATMQRFACLARQTGDDGSASTWRARASTLRAKIKDVAWDGHWYLRAFHDDGSAVGSAKSRECRIDSIAQSWAVLSTDDSDGKQARDRAAVRAADEQLVREDDRLVLLFWPPFDATLHDPGYIRAYPPGVRENGGQYTHAATWLGMAHAALGDGEQAERIFRLLNPILRARSPAESARYRVEPYVLAGDIYSSRPWVGRGGWSWYTGSAAWMWRLGVEAILGLRKEHGQLRIDPCIPPEWKGFEAWVRLGGQTIHIVVDNPDRVSTGIATMTMDGAEVGTNCLQIPPDADGMREVHVRLGAGRAGASDRVASRAG